ncbi:TdeIII family type II restriction endonuclease [Candidatus Micrarchaeota archaeon CG09_land_8_20_14_0_10_55_25]|nr:MAG: TdeIII family type II restriction endonuclease [Candidatus Micrarchaeota archaeon CG09_land_8_20_14_0_10_55_25]
MEEHKAVTLKPSDTRPTKSFSEQGAVKPFHEALLPDGILRITDFERSFSTKLGSTFEASAQFICRDRFAEAIRGYPVVGGVSKKAIAFVESTVNRTGKVGCKWSYPALTKKVASFHGAELKRSCVADLYLKTKSGKELFFEIKSPKPNKGQCLEVTDRLLQIHAIRKAFAPRVRTYFAMAYNPYGEARSAYKHSFTTKYLDFKNQVLIGKEFWDLLGGKGTYEELLAIYREVGRQKGPDMLDQLAFNY